MLPFGINLGVFGLISAAFSRRLDPGDSGSKLYLVIVSAQLLCFMAISPVVSDAINYATYARYQAYGNLEIGWIIFSRVVWMLFPRDKALVLAVGIITLISFSIFFWRYSRNLAISFLVFICMGFWGMSFFILRQLVAMSILLFAYPFLEKRKPVPFFLLVALAAVFHQTAWIFLLVYPITYFGRDARYHVFMFSAGAVLLLCGRSITEFLISVSRNGDMYSITGERSGILLLGLFIIVLIISNYIAPALREYPYSHELELGAVLQTLSITLPVFVRAVDYFSVSLTLILPNACAEIEAGHQRLLAQMALVVLLVVYYFFIADCQFPGGPAAWHLSLSL